MDIKNKEENIGNLKQLNLTLFFFYKSLLHIVPRKHFFHIFKKSGKMYLKHVEYIVINLLEKKKKKEENISILKQLNFSVQRMVLNAIFHKTQKMFPGDKMPKVA